MATGPQARVLELLKRFNNGQKVCIESLQNDPLWYGISDRTISRDLKVIKEYFPNSFELIRASKGEKGCYKAITKDLFEKFMDKNTLALMIQTFNIAQRNSILENLDISAADKKILQSKIEKSNDCYTFISKPYERKKGDEKLLKDIEKAINWKRFITIEHKERSKTVQHTVKPYKIIFINENFYLACENTIHEKQDVSKYSSFRLNNIETISMHSQSFHIDPDLMGFIDSIQTPFAKYTAPFRENIIEVVVNISSQKSRFFELKNHLPSQKIVKRYDDKSIDVSFLVTQEMEVESLIKSWLPHIKVLHPISLKDKIEKELQKYLN